MLTVAQMFLLKTCAALPFFSWMWSSAGAPTSSSCTTPGWMLQAGRTCSSPLCGCEVAPHPLLDPGEVTWEETEPPRWEQPRPTSRWRLRMPQLKLVATMLPRISAQPSADWDIPDGDFPWLVSWRTTNCWGCSSRVNDEPWLCDACLKTATGTTGSVDTASHWAAQTLLCFIEEQDSPELLTKLTLGLEPDDLQSPLPTQAILWFYVSLPWGVLYLFFFNINYN